MRRYPNTGLLAVLALLMSCGAQAGANWQDLKVGGGGYVRGLDVAADGTMVGRTDTNGAYLWNGSNWQQLVTSTSIPASLLNANPVNLGQGVYELQMAPGKSSIMYMMFDGYVFVSTNRGTTWTQTAFSQDTKNNPNDSYAADGQKMAVDPNNPSIVYVGTEDNGMFVTTDGGTTWRAVSGLPAGTGAGITGILFDPAIGGVIGGVTQTIFASSYGNGVYQSTNGGATWTQLTGGPANVQYAAVNSSSGAYYAVGDTGANIWRYANSAWTNLLAAPANTYQALAINPFNQTEIAITAQDGQINLTYDGGATWTGENGATSLSTPDIPWLSAASLFDGTGPSFFLSAGGLAFSPVNNGQLIQSAGTGAWSMNVPATGVTSSTALTWTDMSVGIENVVANAILVPPGGVPILASWDRPFFKITNPNQYPSIYGPVISNKIQMGWSLDYASSDPSFIVGLSDWNTEQTGYSTDGGATWTYFSSTPPGMLSSYLGGTIAASTPQNIIWAPANRSNPYYTIDQGASWTAITLPGVGSWSNFDYAYYLVQRSVTADRVLADTFYLYYPGYGVFKTTNGGVAWTNVHPGYIENNGSLSGKNSMIMSVPGHAGQLFYTGGWQNGSTASNPSPEPFYRSTDGGTTWTAVPNVLAVSCFGFGAPASGQSYPAIYIVGYVSDTFGIWRSDDNAQTWTNIGTHPLGSLDTITTIAGDPNIYGQVYVGFGGGGYAYLPASSGTAQNPVPMAPANFGIR